MFTEANEVNDCDAEEQIRRSIRCHSLHRAVVKGSGESVVKLLLPSFDLAWGLVSLMGFSRATCSAPLLLLKHQESNLQPPIAESVKTTASVCVYANTHVKQCVCVCSCFSACTLLTGFTSQGCSVARPSSSADGRGLQGLMGVSEHNKAWPWLDGGQGCTSGWITPLIPTTICFTGFLPSPSGLICLNLSYTDVKH